MHINWLLDGNNPTFSFTRMGVRFIRALVRQGIQVTPIPMDALQWDGDLRRMAGFHFDRLTIGSMIPTKFPEIPGKFWGFTMWETDTVPRDYVESINEHCERLIVPTAWNEDIFRAAGVKKSIPIHIVPLGIDPHEFPYIERDWEGDKPYTFLCLGDYGGRKGDDIAFTAFFQAFRGVDDVRFIIKCTKRSHENLDLSTSDPRLSLWRESMTNMADVYAQADCFVAPTRGEGWFLPGREAAATGMPVIVTDWGGCSDGIEGYATHPIRDYTLVKASMLGSGNWANCDYHAVADAMRDCYDRRYEVKREARIKSRYLHEHGTWDKAAGKLIEVIDKQYIRMPQIVPPEPVEEMPNGAHG